MDRKALRKTFDECLTRMPEFAPEFEPHRAWAEQFAWFAVQDVAERIAPQPLTSAQIHTGFDEAQADPKESFVFDLHDFYAGVLFAERAHGIGGT